MVVKKKKKTGFLYITSLGDNKGYQKCNRVKLAGRIPKVVKENTGRKQLNNVKRQKNNTPPTRMHAGLCN